VVVAEVEMTLPQPEEEAEAQVELRRRRRGRECLDRPESKRTGPPLPLFASREALVWSEKVVEIVSEQGEAASRWNLVLSPSVMLMEEKVSRRAEQKRILNLMQGYHHKGSIVIPSNQTEC
jgi:hypothetical protein